VLVDSDATLLKLMNETAKFFADGSAIEERCDLGVQFDEALTDWLHLVTQSSRIALRRAARSSMVVVRFMVVAA